MVENDSEITQEWKCPPEGFNDDNDDDEEDSTKYILLYKNYNYQIYIFK